MFLILIFLFIVFVSRTVHRLPIDELSPRPGFQDPSPDIFDTPGDIVTDLDALPAVDENDGNASTELDTSACPLSTVIKDLTKESTIDPPLLHSEHICPGVSWLYRFAVFIVAGELVVLLCILVYYCVKRKCC